MLLELDGVNAYYDKSHVLQNVSLHDREGRGRRAARAQRLGPLDDVQDDHGPGASAHGHDPLQGQGDHQQEPVLDGAGGIAFVPEDRRIFPNLTVGENLRLAALAGRKGAWTEKRIYE